MKAPVFEGYGTAAATRGQLVATVPTAVPASTWSYDFYRRGYYISDYKSSTCGYKHLQLLVQQHLRQIQQRQLRLIRQQHYYLEGSIIRRQQIGLPNARLYMNLRDISTRTRTSFYVSTIEPTPSNISKDVWGGISHREFRCQIGYSYLYRSPLVRTRGSKHKEQTHIRVHGSGNTSSTNRPGAFSLLLAARSGGKPYLSIFEKGAHLEESSCDFGWKTFAKSRTLRSISSPTSQASAGPLLNSK